MDDGEESDVGSSGLEMVMQNPAPTIESALENALGSDLKNNIGLPIVKSSETHMLALAWTKARRGRNMVFGSHLFSDPAWDILLDLYVSRCNGKNLSVSDVCQGSYAPMTTALRWVSHLERERLICRKADPTDKRRWFLMLTEDGLHKMEAALRKAADSDQKLGLGRLELNRPESLTHGNGTSLR